MRLFCSRFSSRLGFWASMSEIEAKWEHISSESNKIYEKSLSKNSLLSKIKTYPIYYKFRIPIRTWSGMNWKLKINKVGIGFLH
jgi:hypothetical protein